MVPSSASLPSHFSFCSSVAPTRMGSVPRWMARNAVADAQADLGHLFRDRGYVARAAAHAPVLLGDEEQLQADLGPEQLADGFLGEDLVGVPLAQLLRRQHPLPDLREQVEHHFAFFDG